MRAIAAATALFLIASPAVAASPQVEAGTKVLKAIASDPAKLDKFCKVMKVVDGLQDQLDRIQARISTSLEQALGESFKAYIDAAKKVDDDADESPDSKALSAAFDELTDKCPD